MPAEGGVYKYKVHITQSEVDANFVMFVPVFADFGGGLVRLGQMAVVGNSTRTVIFDLERQTEENRAQCVRETFLNVSRFQAVYRALPAAAPEAQAQ